MKAIVLSCDKYHPIANLCIASYEKHWPRNPFEFVVPYQDAPHSCFSQRNASQIRFVHAPEPIVETMAVLLAGIPDEEWVYWCMDDYYVIRMDTKIVTKVYEQVAKFSDKNIICVRLINSNKRPRCSFVIDGLTIGSELRMQLVEYPGSQGTRFRLIWQHQFVRAGALRYLLQSFPREPSHPKEMDAFPHLKKSGQQILEVSRTALSLGESTSRGKIIANCVIALKQYGMKIPEEFELDLSKTTVQGELPVRCLGVSFYPSWKWILRWAGFLLRYYGFRSWWS